MHGNANASKLLGCTLWGRWCIGPRGYCCSGQCDVVFGCRWTLVQCFPSQTSENNWRLYFSRTVDKSATSSCSTLRLSPRIRKGGDYSPSAKLCGLTIELSKSPPSRFVIIFNNPHTVAFDYSIFPFPPASIIRE